MVSSAGPGSLADAEARRRARRLTLVLSDVDGVWTDAGVWYSEAGELLKRFSLRDGMGVERLRGHGILTGIVTGENSKAVARRAEKLGLEFVFMGVQDKRSVLSLLKVRGIECAQLAFIGDDHNDLGLIERVRRYGLTGAPNDALPSVARTVHWRSEYPGGHGAFREFAEWLIELRRTRIPARRERGTT